MRDDVVNLVMLNRTDIKAHYYESGRLIAIAIEIHDVMPHIRVGG